MTIKPIPAAVPVASVFGERVLAYTEARGILADLTIDINNLHASLTSALAKRDENLPAQLDAMLADAVAQWRKGNGNGALDADNYEHARGAVIGRVRALERRARAAADRAAALAALLDTLEHYDTPEDIIWAIDHVAGQYENGHYTSDADVAADLTALWHRLTPSALVSADAVDLLRRHYDANLHGAVERSGHLGHLRSALDAWREGHLARAKWTAGTFAYAIATARDWDELADLWQLLMTPATDKDGNPTPEPHRATTGPENIRLRTAIAAKVAEYGDTHVAIPHRLREAVIEFNTSTTALVARIRMAETMHDLLAVSDVITGRARDAEGALNIMRAHNCKYDQLTATAPDAEVEGDDWAPAATLRDRVQRWRAEVWRAANSSNNADQRGHYTPDTRYELLYNALAEAVDAGEVRLAADLLAVADEAVAEQMLAEEHHNRLHALAATRGERITVNGDHDQ